MWAKVLKVVLVDSGITLLYSFDKKDGIWEDI